MGSARGWDRSVPLIWGALLFLLQQVTEAASSAPTPKYKPAPPEFKAQPWEKVLFAFILIGFVTVAGISTALKIKYSVSGVSLESTQ